MKWMNTQELVSILQRFPKEQVEASVYLGSGLVSNHIWMYSIDDGHFQHTLGDGHFQHTSEAKSRRCSEAELYRSYSHHHWKVKPSFFLRNGHEKQMALRIVEELGVLGLLEDFITECELDNVRICEHCHHLMDEGWLVDDCRTFCSDECLRSAYPNIDISELQAQPPDSDCWAYWTRWEE